MEGLMQQQPLLISTLLEHASRHHGATAVVSRRTEGGFFRTTWRDTAVRAHRLAHALDGLRLAPGERVGTLAWNTHRHLELYFGVSGSGRVLHTINPRLHAQQVAWIVNHAQDRAVCFDLAFLALVREILPLCPHVRHWIALCEDDRLPADTGIAGLASYEALLGTGTARYPWPALDENSASTICYTSGTTGPPKGVLYSHRSAVLNAYAAATPDAMNLSARDAVLPVVPMFHVNAWGMVYAAALVGAVLVLPAQALGGEALYELIEAEQVTFAAGVPTVWQGLLDHMASRELRFTALGRAMIGGSTCPESMIRDLQERHGVQVIHAWGMTETSPLGIVCTPKREHLGLAADEMVALCAKQGRAIFGIDMRIVGDDGHELAWDGKSCGELQVKGPAIVRDYYGNTEGSPLRDGWFPTGDVATIDAQGYVQITDRSKDLIKSGGEWISSVALEAVACAHPAVKYAACIGVAHPRWGQRPVVVAVLKPGAALGRDELIRFYEGKVARWQIPDDAIFLDDMPLGPTGKVLKSALRELVASRAPPRSPG
ncbi:MAG TPA: 3-(methylthio)propionyl-CoA ligase [Ramlibacter sp.]|uniref:3-(methylthio)propionyl-CoA ligase n=1 Tax=Ramlibacter sp. TaxID=1917967 RepID=UPI002B8CC872|nr:3-(methylthio)propionyl-CoA ligase [Ramlibacter sp.]HVZ42210.1 3-(methylthio)propionyl-CoA ligase [Ramlibacter sp.]